MEQSCMKTATIWQKLGFRFSDHNFKNIAVYTAVMKSSILYLLFTFSYAQIHYMIGVRKYKS